jgi:DsbC/DsbD-like thiol-disulfide interchange protein
MTVMQKASVAVLALCAAVVLGAPFDFAQGGQAPAVDLSKPGPQATKETVHLTVKTTASDETAAPGHKVSLLVDVSPKPKMHVYAPGQEGYIAITLRLDADPAFTAGKAKYPAGEKLFMKILNETQLVYAKPFRIVQDVTLALTREMRQRAAADGASLTIKGTLRYQACDDKICYLPANVPVEWRVKLTPLS